MSMSRRTRKPPTAQQQKKPPRAGLRSGKSNKPDRPLASAEDAAWNRSFHQLHLYHRQHGHCDVSAHEKIHRKLAAWVAQQREIQQRGGMRPERQTALDALQFAWETGDKKPRDDAHREAKWERRYAELIAFQQKHGHSRVTKGPPGNKELWHWRHMQREWRRKGILKPERIARLDAISFEWEEPDRFARSHDKKWEHQWERMFQQLVQFKERFGHCRVVTDWKENPNLSKWVIRHRMAHRRHELRPDRKARLDALGFDWDLEDGGQYKDLWEQRYAELAAFQQLHGHTRVTKSPPGNKVLGDWRHNQREFRRKGLLKPERIARLDAIGFEWEEPDRLARSQDEKWEQQWERMFQQLVQFQERFSHCRVVTGWKENPDLSKWVMRHRTALRRHELRADRTARLDALGFEWELEDGAQLKDLWERRYAELAAFQKLHGHTRVTKIPPGNKVLGDWRHNQREFRRQGLLKPERIARLDAIGFEWADPPGPSRAVADYCQQLWNAKFEFLRHFHERFGHTRVPKRWKEDPSLAAWVMVQRRAGHRNLLKPERRAQLESLGFAWPSIEGSAYGTDYQAARDRRLTDLAAFQERFGHTRVPVRWKEDPGLGAWASMQRHLRRKGLLSARRTAQLDALGFEWGQPRRT